MLNVVGSVSVVGVVGVVCKNRLWLLDAKSTDAEALRD